MALPADNHSPISAYPPSIIATATINLITTTSISKNPSFMAKSSNNDTISIPSLSIFAYLSHHHTHTLTSVDEAALPTCLVRGTVEIDNLDAVTAAALADGRLKRSNLENPARFAAGIL
ncbi:hypothetical protein G7Y79_00026g058430 [Physcia stellaris]|nr:hypothetical protein G7Y79_00026g058430 [Physcia stellaris]